jgi:hypothetical protein
MLCFCKDRIVRDSPGGSLNAVAAAGQEGARHEKQREIGRLELAER